MMGHRILFHLPPYPIEGMLPHFAKPGALPARTGVPPGMKTQLLKMRVGQPFICLDTSLIFFYITLN